MLRCLFLVSQSLLVESREFDPPPSLSLDVFYCSEIGLDDLHDILLQEDVFRIPVFYPRLARQKKPPFEVSHSLTTIRPWISYPVALDSVKAFLSAIRPPNPSPIPQQHQFDATLHQTSLLQTIRILRDLSSHYCSPSDDPPPMFLVWRQCSNWSFSLHDYELSLEFLKLQSAAFPNTEPESVSNMVACSRFRDGDFKGAVEACRRTQALAPEFPYGYSSMSAALFATGEPILASEMVSRSIAIQPDCWRHAARGFIRGFELREFLDSWLDAIEVIRYLDELRLEDIDVMSYGDDQFQCIAIGSLLNFTVESLIDEIARKWSWWRLVVSSSSCSSSATFGDLMLCLFAVFKKQEEESIKGRRGKGKDEFNRLIVSEFERLQIDVSDETLDYVCDSLLLSLWDESNRNRNQTISMDLSSYFFRERMMLDREFCDIEILSFENDGV